MATAAQDEVAATATQSRAVVKTTMATLVPTSTEVAKVAHLALEATASANTMAAMASDETPVTAVVAKKALKQGKEIPRHYAFSPLPIDLRFIPASSPTVFALSENLGVHDNVL